VGYAHQTSGEASEANEVNDLHRKMVANGDYRLVIVASEGELRSLCRALDTCRFHIIEAHHDDPDDEEVDEQRRLLDSLNVLQARMEAKLDKVGEPPAPSPARDAGRRSLHPLRHG
jgi:vacuolar-type H+-ATPase subunit I/STV1